MNTEKTCCGYRLERCRPPDKTAVDRKPPMSEAGDLLIKIARPCKVSWDSMSGGATVRFCGYCDKHVYNASEMTQAELTRLISHTEGRVCLKLYKRQDGTVVTKDCPVSSSSPLGLEVQVNLKLNLGLYADNGHEMGEAFAFRKALYAVTDISPGTELTANHVALREVPLTQGPLDTFSDFAGVDGRRALSTAQGTAYLLALH